MAEWTSRAATGFGSEAAYGADPAPRALKTRSTHVCDTLARAGSPRKPENRGSAFGLGNELGRRDDAKGREKLSLDRNGIKLAEFLCRSQTRSPKFPGLNGTWFRAFDDQRWEAWASSADVGWGAWSSRPAGDRPGRRRCWACASCIRRFGISRPAAARESISQRSRRRCCPEASGRQKRSAIRSSAPHRRIHLPSPSAWRITGWVWARFFGW